MDDHVTWAHSKVHRTVYLFDYVKCITDFPLGADDIAVLVGVLHQRVGDCQYLVLCQLL